MRPMRNACSAVIRPQMIMEANTAHISSASGALAARKIIIGIRIIPLSDSIANCRPRPNVSPGGGLSSGS